MLHSPHCARSLISSASSSVLTRCLHNSSAMSQRLKLKSMPAEFWRGGTSKGILLNKADLPADRAEWSPILLAMMGSPDPYGRQLDGLGGGLSSLSKVCIVDRSSRPDADVDYTFVQVRSGSVRPSRRKAEVYATDWRAGKHRRLCVQLWQYGVCNWTLRH